MQTQILKGNVKKNIYMAVSLIRRGELVAFPTETVYGLGADATNETAVAKIFAAKGRPHFDPLIIHVSSFSMLEGILKEIPDKARILAESFWPGPLTLVLPKREEIPDIVTAGLPTVAVRIPQNKIALNLIKEAGVPIAAPSANIFGHPSPTCAGHVIQDLGGKIALILDGGPTRVGVESTVVDLTHSPPVILRPGGVGRESLEDILGGVTVFSGMNEEALKSPGQMKQHYAPRAKVLLFQGKCQKKIIAAMRETINKLNKGYNIGIMVPEEMCFHFRNEEVILEGLSSFTDMNAVARNIYTKMRLLDSKKVSHILVLAPPEQGIGLAVYDRLFKAAGSQLVEVDR